MKKGGVYIHIPFCSNKCIYCDFYTGGVRIANWENYVNAINIELSTRIKEIDFIPSSLYIGGGTPSLMPPEFFLSLISKIQQQLNFSAWKEFTIEVNPENVTPENLEAWKSANVNRISLGVQTLNDKELKSIGRSHSAAQAIEAMEMISRNFNNFSVDVMFGLPGQSLESYQSTLSGIISCAPAHISAYSLMLEEATALSLLVSQGKIILPSETDWLEMYEFTNNFLASKGYERYEISNYSLNGLHSHHNMLYWTGNPYIGLGPGAHSYDGKALRRANPNDIKVYMKHFNGSLKTVLPPFFIEESLSEDELREEMIMTRLRTVKGLNLEEFNKNFDTNETDILLKKARKYITSGHISLNNEYLSLTSSGFFIYNTILSSLI